MKNNTFLLIEQHFDSNKIKTIIESNKSTNEKEYFTVGKTIYCDGNNGNNRVYPKNIMTTAIDKYKKEKMGKIFTAMGELNHPVGDEESMQVNPAKASHKFVDIWEEKDGWFFTKAKVMNTPNGKIVKTLLDEGITLGISTRGVGEIQEDYETGYETVSYYELITPGDYVTDPSAPGAFLDVVKEGKFSIYTDGENIRIKKFKETVDKNWKVNRNKEENNDMLNNAFKKLIEEFKK